MAINLEENKDSLLSAWKDVIDDKSSTDWTLFSYEGQTNNLKVVSKGDGGIEEMREELNSGKIMYAFCKVLDPKTSLFKYVLVNWQGEGAPHHRKATSANHIRDVSNLLKGFHVTVNARNEEEVDTDIIIEKLSKASAYSFKDRGETIKDSGPVGTTYKRVIPEQEINSNERDKFWQKEEEEEKQRQEAERLRREEEKRKLENEIKQREIEEAVQREAKIKERSKSISVLRDVERNELMRINAANLVEKVDDIGEREKEEIERKDRSDVLRRQRSEEAQALISKRTINARAVFEKNTSAGQLLQRRASHQPTSNTSVISPVKEEIVRWPPSQHTEATSKEEERERWPSSIETTPKEEERVRWSPSQHTETTLKEEERVRWPLSQHREAIPKEEERVRWPPSQHTEATPKEEERVRWPPSQHTEATPKEEERVRWPPSQHTEATLKKEIESVTEDTSVSQSLHNVLENRPPLPVDAALPQANVSTEHLNGLHSVSENGNSSEVKLAQNSNLERAQPYLDEVFLNNGTLLEDYEDLDLRAQALYDYQAADDTEISFDPGDIITRIDQIDAGWWQGMAPDGSYGLFPANYVQLLD